MIIEGSPFSIRPRATMTRMISLAPSRIRRIRPLERVRRDAVVGERLRHVADGDAIGRERERTSQALHLVFGANVFTRHCPSSAPAAIALRCDHLTV
jgi:hypothetical protein